MTIPSNIESLTAAELRTLVIELLERVADLSRIVLEQREEIARLKGLKGGHQACVWPQRDGEGEPASVLEDGQAAGRRPKDGASHDP